MAMTIEAIVDQIIANYEKNLLGAAVHASNKVTEDIYKYSIETCLERYYGSYYPTSYDRTDSLHNAIQPYAPKTIKGGKTVKSEVGIEYDSSALSGVYSGSRQYTPTDGAWVLDNYLEGIHPATNGSRDPDSVVYYEITGPSPYLMMQSYLKTTVPALYKTYLMSYMVKAIK